MISYRRRLPHIHEIGRTIFITWRLNGTLPPSFQVDFGADPGHAFGAMDRMLDHGRFGPRYLELPQIANLVMESIVYRADKLRHYELHNFVVMPNHVHLLITPLQDIVKIMKSLKGYTARQANAALGRSGRFWQRESYDHLVRTDKEFDRIAAYIERNPVRAGLVQAAEEYRWSSAWRER